MELRNTKIRIKDKEECIRVQKELFKRGCNWFSREQKPCNTNAKFLFIRSSLTMGFCIEDRDDFFNKHPSKEIKVSDLLRNEKREALKQRLLK